MDRTKTRGWRCWATVSLLWMITMTPASTYAGSVACCFADDSCSNLPELFCLDQGGIPQGTSGCSPNPCVQTQACCFDDGSCSNLDFQDCFGAGGTGQGEGTACTASICPQACCLPAGNCFFLSQSGCLESGGTSQGSGVTCASAGCSITVCPGAGDCQQSNGTPGCDDAQCCSAVCEADPFCCNTFWDQACANGAASACCGGSASGSCFDQNGTPFCDDVICCTVVCAVDPFCCDSSWDSLCVGEAEDRCLCGGSQAGSCFEANSTPGCADDICCQIVCSFDAFCCDTQWDGQCANEAGDFCNSSCPGDVDNDGVVGVGDLVEVITNWGNCQ